MTALPGKVTRGDGETSRLCGRPQKQYGGCTDVQALNGERYCVIDMTGDESESSNEMAITSAKTNCATDGKFTLCDLNQDVLERIMDCLPPKALLALTSTCKHLRGARLAVPKLACKVYVYCRDNKTAVMNRRREQNERERRIIDNYRHERAIDQAEQRAIQIRDDKCCMDQCKITTKILGPMFTLVAIIAVLQHMTSSGS